MANGAALEKKETRARLTTKKKTKHNLPKGTRLKPAQQEAVWRAEAAGWDTISKAEISK